MEKFNETNSLFQCAAFSTFSSQRKKRTPEECQTRKSSCWRLCCWLCCCLLKHVPILPLLHLDTWDCLAKVLRILKLGWNKRQTGHCKLEKRFSKCYWIENTIKSLVYQELWKNESLFFGALLMMLLHCSAVAEFKKGRGPQTACGRKSWINTKSKVTKCLQSFVL